MIFEIEKKENKLVLKSDFKLPNIIKFQLQYFGFNKSDKNDLLFENHNEEVNINEILIFLDENNINYSLSHDLQKIITDDFESSKEFNKKTSKLTDIKKNSNSKEFDEFCKKIFYLNRPLKLHQKKSLFHLYNAKSAANFSVPGSGKTSVVLAFYEYLKLNHQVDSILLIGPKNCYYSWKTEFKLNLSRDPNIKILDDNKNHRKKIYDGNVKSEIYALHFSTVVNDLIFLKKFLQKKLFMIVIDEAHNMKKIGGVWSNAILALKDLSEFKIVLTGTPMPQEFKDFYNYIDFLYPDRNIITPTEKAKIEVHIDNNQYDEAAELINKKLFPFYTRVTKKELGLSQPNFLKPYKIKMNPIEEKIHKAIITKIKYYSKNDYLKNIDLIKKIQRARIIRLRQICSYAKNLITAIPSEYIEGDENLLKDNDLQSLIAKYDLNEIPAKLVKLIEICNTLKNKKEKILIWSTHLKTIDLILKKLKQQDINIKKITGKTLLQDRESIKDEFNDPNSNLDAIVAIPQACSESISLHKACQNAVYYDMNFNTSEFLQSLDRIHRVGGSEEKPVYYHFLHYEDSVDLKVYERVFDKADRQMQVIENDNLTFSQNYDDNWEELYNSVII